MKNKINIIFFGRFDYPFGMASTKRIQHFVNFIAENGHNAKVLRFRPDGQRNVKNIIIGKHKKCLYKIVGLKINYRTFSLFYYIIS